MKTSDRADRPRRTPDLQGGYDDSAFGAGGTQRPQALHRSDRRIGVITRGHQRELYLAILTGADDEDAARSHALRLVTAALDELGLADAAPHIEIGDVTSQPVLPGRARPVKAPPPLAYRSATLPDGRVLSAACAEPLGEWFAYVAPALKHGLD